MHLSGFGFSPLAAWQSQKTVYNTALDYLGESDLQQILCLIMIPSILTLQSELGL